VVDIIVNNGGGVIASIPADVPLFSGTSVLPGLNDNSNHCSAFTAAKSQ